MRTGVQTPISPIPPPSGAATPQSTWQSQKPYLYGGLAFMLGLMALALFILAYSYFTSDGSDRSGDKKSLKEGRNPAGSFLEQFVVIMAGDQIPTFLATPIPSHTTAIAGMGGGKDNQTQPD